MAATIKVIWRFFLRNLELPVNRYISTGHNVFSHVKVGTRLPDVDVYKDSPTNAINIAKLFKGKKGVLFSVPGAFTPGCAQAHIPEYLEHWDKFASEGIDIIACVSVNDPFVMSAWAKEVDPHGKMEMLADTNCTFTKEIGMELDAVKLLGNTRSRRYSLIIEDGFIKHINMAPDDTGLACLLCLRSTSKTDKLTAMAQELFDLRIKDKSSVT